jgi:DnaD/phage-associated family protein
VSEQGTGTRSRFAGFPSGARATAVPSVFFSELLPQIDGEDELRVTLYLFYALGRRKGYPRFVTEAELMAEAPLYASLGDGDEAPPRVRNGLAAAVRRGSILRLDVQHAEHADILYFLNTPSDRRAVEQIRDGRIDLGRALPELKGAPAPREGSVFQLYEENIGPITPLIAEELKEAEELYPYEWLEEALREAALLNKRSWRYASRILQRWATEGRTREKTGRDPGEGHSIRARVTRRFDESSGR